MIVAVPEPFASALKESRPRDVQDAEAATPEALYGRAMARLQLGRDRDARADLESAEPVLLDAARIEIAFLDMRERESVENALFEAEGVLSRALPGKSGLRARALHVLGLAKAKLRIIEGAMDALLEASAIYEEIEDLAGRAQVLDTLGMLHSSRGRLDLALSAYAVSLVEKTLCGDRYGMAITLGNLGRVHLKAGRYRDALRSFQADHRLAFAMGDRRGCGRMLDDMGRARLGLGDLARAEADFRGCLELALDGGFRDLEFFARKDLAAALVAQGRLDEAENELERARELAQGAEPYFHSLLLAARGELALARRDPRAVEILEEAARKFAESDLPDHEIPLWITLARAYADQKLKRMAEVCLETALERARRDGFERYLPLIREEMAALGWMGNLAEERDRLPASPRADAAVPDGYVVLERIGGGTYGEVFRAYDPTRDQVVALKVFQLQVIYDVEQRDGLLRSARVELETASRIRHPGVARVFALGHDQGGNAYVVQEFVKGRSLRELMSASPPGRSTLVLRHVQLVAAALHALHAAGLVHRDLKPENIILRAPDDSPVLVDFGIAYLEGYEEGFPATALGGTFPYMAPEVFRREPVTPKADIYSLGVLAHEWLGGRLPWDVTGKTWAVAVAEKINVPPLPLPGGLSPGLVALVERLMDAFPPCRPGADEVADLCGKLLKEERDDDIPILPGLTGPTPGLTGESTWLFEGPGPA